MSKHRRPITQLAFLLLMLTLLSCGKSDDPDPNAEITLAYVIDNLVGTHPNGARYCSTRDLVTGNYTYDTMRNLTFIISRESDSIISVKMTSPGMISGFGILKFYGRLTPPKSYYFHTPGSFSPGMAILSSDTSFSVISVSNAPSGLGNPVSCHYQIVR